LVVSVIIEYFKSISTVATVQQNLEAAKLSVNIFSGFQIAALIMTMAIYPMLSWWSFYRKDGYRGLVAEFKFIKKVLMSSFFVTVALTILQIINQIVSPLGEFNPDWMGQIQICSHLVNNLAPSLTFFCPVAALTSVGRDSIIFYSISGFATIVFYSALLKIISLVFRKDFTFYLAKGYVNTATRKTSDVEKMRYLGLSLKSYDLYLRKRLDLSIRDVSLIFSKEFVVNKQVKKETIEPFRSSFENEKLGPLDYLVSIANNDDADEILTGEIVKPISEVVKEYGVWLATVIPVVILILQFVLLPSK
jgi:hypothetical protein